MHAAAAAAANKTDDPRLDRLSYIRLCVCVCVKGRCCEAS